jgi:hypothetical protein
MEIWKIKEKQCRKYLETITNKNISEAEKIKIPLPNE